MIEPKTVKAEGLKGCLGAGVKNVKNFTVEVLGFAEGSPLDVLGIKVSH